MATYAELLLASEGETLRNQVRVACIVAAETISAEDGAVVNHANRLLWARNVLRNPDGDVMPMVWALLAKNKGATLAAIQSVTDAQVQTAVDSAVNVLAQG